MLDELRGLRETLQDLGDGNHRAWLRISSPVNLMDRGIREGVAGSHEPETLSLLGDCWDALNGSTQAKSAIDLHCEKIHHIDKDDRPKVVSRLYKNARAKVATGCAAVEAKRCIQDACAPANLLRWLREAASLFGTAPTEDVATSPAGGCWQTDPADLVRYACDALAAQSASITTPRLWTLDLLNAGHSEIRDSISNPVAGFDGKGFLLDLQLSRVEKASSEFVEHPEMALRTFGKDMLEALSRVWQDIGVPARWELRRRDGESATALDGPSLGGALAVGLRVLRDRRPYDSLCIILAQVAGELLEAVGNEKEKLDAALDQGFRRAVVGSKTKVRSLIRDYAAKGLEVREIGTISEAVEFASGQLIELERVLETETSRVLNDAKNRIRSRKFEKWQDLDSLFVPVKVARGLRPRLSQSEYEQLERQRREGDFGGLDRLIQRRLDPREERLQPELRRVTVDWENVHSGIRRAVVLGDAGFGKTMLLWHEVGQRNEDWRNRIAQSKAGLAQTEVAVFVRALELAQWIERGEKILDALITRRSAEWRANRETVDLVRAKLAEGTGLIAIDALDEVSAALRPALDAALGGFSSMYPQARILLSSRLVGYTRAPIAIQENDEFEVLAFEPSQMQSAVTAWFNPDAAGGAEAWRHIQSQSAILGDLRCPLLLRLSCALIGEARKKSAGLPNWERRGELYEAFLLDGVRRWSEAANPGAQARGRFLDFAGELALELWKKDARRTLWDEQAIAREIDRVLPGYSALLKRSESNNTDLIRDLCDAGILSRAGADDPETPLMFTHRSFGEYLAARALAERLKASSAGAMSGT